MPNIILSQRGAQLANGQIYADILAGASNSEASKTTRESIIRSMIDRLAALLNHQVSVRNTLESHGVDLAQLIKYRRLDGSGKLLNTEVAVEDIISKLQNLQAHMAASKTQIDAMRKDMEEFRKKEEKFIIQLQEAIAKNPKINIQQYLASSPVFSDLVTQQTLRNKQIDKTLANIEHDLTSALFYGIKINAKTHRLNYSLKDYCKRIGKPTSTTLAQLEAENPAYKKEYDALRHLVTTVNNLLQHGNTLKNQSKKLFSSVGALINSKDIRMSLEQALDQLTIATKERVAGKEAKAHRRQSKQLYGAAKNSIAALYGLDPNDPVPNEWEISALGSSLTVSAKGAAHENFGVYATQLLMQNNALTEKVIAPNIGKIVQAAAVGGSDHATRVLVDVTISTDLSAIAADETFSKEEQEERHKLISKVAAQIWSVHKQYDEPLDTFEDAYILAEKAITDAYEMQYRSGSKKQDKIDDFIELEVNGSPYFIAFSDKFKNVFGDSKYGGNIDSLKLIQTGSATLRSSWDMFEKIDDGNLPFSADTLISALINATSASIYHNEGLFEEVEEFFQSILNGYFMETTFNITNLENQITTLTNTSQTARATTQNTYLALEVNNLTIPAESIIRTIIAQLRALLNEQLIEEIVTVDIKNMENRSPMGLYTQSLAAVPPKAPVVGGRDQNSETRWAYAANQVMQNIKINTAVNTSALFSIFGV